MSPPRSARPVRALTPANGHSTGQDALSGDVLPQNGHGLTMPRHEKEVELHAERYPGWRMTIWVNYPQRVRSAMFYSGDDETKRAERDRALRRVVLAHNGWADDEGIAFSPANTPEFWDEIPTEVAGAILARLNMEGQRLGFSMMRNWTPSADD